jgi:pimeloyl-ACP methyl ester carboxylesterase
MKQYLWTLDGGRLQFQSSHKNCAINWLFIPGGPGLGSEVLADLTQLLKNQIPGAIWHFDLPNDGSNILKDQSICNWYTAIMQAVSSLENVILVAHSTSAMFVQTMPELEEFLHGLVLIGTAPDASWQKLFSEYRKENMDAFITQVEEEYLLDPNNETLRKLLIAEAKNCFVTKQSLASGKELLNKAPINQAADKLYSKVFNSETYKATWIPQTLNTLIMNGSEDHITPLKLFGNNASYQRNNIVIKEIVGAGHYPWFENPSQITQAFENFYEMKLKSKT